jgi:uncharacterized protein
MQNRWLDESFGYDGSQLRSLFAYMKFGIRGDSLVAWRGPCDVDPKHMVDGEDLRDRAAIRGADMIHFIFEKFDCSLLAAVSLQRLLTTVVRDVLVEIAGEKGLAQELRRDGDDLYLGPRKLSISIATVSPVSALVHFAVNVSNDNTPVPTLSLMDLNVDPQAFAKAVLALFATEVRSIVDATQKVFWVK